MSGVAMQIDDKWIQGIVAAEVEGALVKALGSDVYQKTIEGIVRRALTEKVDSDGKPTQYSNGQSYVQYLLAHEIRELTKAALKRMIADKQQEFEAIITQELERSKGDMATKMMGEMTRAITSGWNIRVNVDWNKNGE